jgi:hypothetical protein
MESGESGSGKEKAAALVEHALLDNLVRLQDHGFLRSRAPG